MAPKSNAVQTYQPPLTPVSEAESDSTTIASTSNATTSSAASSEQSYFHSRPLNFSRPRPVDYSPAHRVHHDRSDSCGTPGALPHVRSFDAFDTKRSSLPDTPSFAIEFDEPVKEVVQDEVEFPWDEHLKDIKPVKRFIDYDGQRSQPRKLYQQSNQNANTTMQRSRSMNAPEVVPQSKASLTALPQPKPPQKIEEDPAEAEWDGEDTQSHHTVSENGDIAELGDSTWMSSSHSLDSLSEKEIQKLRKKGINPALYAEMKAARRGKGKWGMNVLSGNAYLS